MKKLLMITALAAFSLTCATAGLAAEATPVPGPKSRGMWKFEQCDKDSDGVLSLDEFLACHPKATKDMHAAMDSNGDGKVTPEEMRAHFQAKRQEWRSQEFARCDANNDGMLSKEEFMQCKPERPMGMPGMHHPECPGNM